MKRRTFLLAGLALALETRLFAALRRKDLDEASAILANATAGGQVASAALHVAHGHETFTRSFGGATSNDAMFLLGSITKPMSVTALMTLYDQGQFDLDDPLKKFIPRFTSDGRDDVTLRHLLTHVSGLPDQLAENDSLRKNHASLAEFVEHAVRAPLGFAPGSRYQYSSMAILLASHVAELASGTEVRDLVDQAVFRPLGMEHAALGLGRFKLDDMVACQTENAAPESGGGDPAAKEWDWNSPYWRELGAPWGGAHVSAPDVGRFLAEFLFARGEAVRRDTAKLMTANHNAAGLTPRGLGFAVGTVAASAGCSERSFGHTGSTGTLCWADPTTETICVVLTSLPARAAQPHPSKLAAERVAAAAG